MANPARRHDDPQNPAGNEPRVENPNVVRTDRGMGTSVLIAAVVLALAVIAYFAFGPSRTPNTTVTANQPAATEPAIKTPMAAAPAVPKAAEPTAPAPGATAPAAPQSSAPAEPAKPAQ